MNYDCSTWNTCVQNDYEYISLDDSVSGRLSIIPWICQPMPLNIHVLRRCILMPFKALTDDAYMAVSHELPGVAKLRLER